VPGKNSWRGNIERQEAVVETKTFLFHNLRVLIKACLSYTRHFHPCPIFVSETKPTLEMLIAERSRQSA
jgi:hypothetical protein